MPTVDVGIGIGTGTGIVVVIRVRAGTVYCAGIDVVVCVVASTVDRAGAGTIVVGIYQAFRVIDGLRKNRDRKKSCNNARYYNFFHTIRSRVWVIKYLWGELLKLSYQIISFTRFRTMSYSGGIYIKPGRLFPARLLGAQQSNSNSKFENS